MNTCLIGLFSTNEKLKVLAFNSTEVGLVPTKDNLPEITRRVLELKNPAGNSYIPTEVTNASAEIVASKNLLYSPTKGFDTIIYLRYVTATESDMPLGYTILDQVVGTVNTGEIENIYSKKVILNISTVDGSGEPIEGISDDDDFPTEPLQLSLDKAFSKFSGDTYLDSFTKSDGIQEIPRYIRDRYRVNLGTLDPKGISLSSPSSFFERNTEEHRFWFGSSKNGVPELSMSLTNSEGAVNCGLYEFTSTAQNSGGEHIPTLVVPDGYDGDYSDLFRTESFAIDSDENIISSSDRHSIVLGEGNDRPLFNLWSPYLEYPRSEFSSTQDLLGSIPGASDIILPVNLLLNSKRKIKIIIKIGRWYLFDLDQYGCWILVNNRTSVILKSGLKTFEVSNTIEETSTKYIDAGFYVINNRSVLVRDERGELYLIREPGNFMTPSTAVSLMSTYPYSKTIKNFTSGGELIDETSLPNGPLSKYRRKWIDAHAESRVIGAMMGFIFYIYTDNDEGYKKINFL